MGVPIVAMKPFSAGNILKGHEDGWLKGLLELPPVQCISYIPSIADQEFLFSKRQYAAITGRERKGNDAIACHMGNDLCAVILLV